MHKESEVTMLFSGGVAMSQIDQLSICHACLMHTAIASYTAVSNGTLCAQYSVKYKKCKRILS